MNVKSALKWAKDRLMGAGTKSESPELSENYALDAQIILEHTLKKQRGFALVHPEAEITPEAERSFKNDIGRRAAGVCTAYITGHKSFRSLDLFVSKDVLVPQPDTETLVEAALELIDGMGGSLLKPLKVLDLGTGSGAIALSLFYERPGVEIHASDISKKALEAAHRNCALCVGNRQLPTPNFIQSDLFQNISDSYDLIVSNPPYIPTKMIAGLPPEVRGQPRLALDGGEDGLALIRRIIKEAPARLKPGGHLLLEAAPDLMPQISKLLGECGYANISIKKDLNGEDRVIVARYGVMQPRRRA